MTEVDKQRLALESLKALNAAIIATKLYPPSFPQVKKAVENSYKEIKYFTRKYGTLSYNIVDREAILCGQKVSQKTLGKVHGADVFQQLKVLERNNLVLDRSFTRHDFQNILSFFTASPQLVKKEGGIELFVINLGVKRFFPSEYKVEILQAREDRLSSVHEQLLEKMDIEKEQLSILFEKEIENTDENKQKLSYLQFQLNNQQEGSEIIVTGVCALLEGMHISGSIYFPSSYKLFHKNVSLLLSEENRDKLAGAASQKCLEMIDDWNLKTILLQEHTSSFGHLFYTALVKGLGQRFDNIVKLLREEEEFVKRTSGSETEQAEHITEGKERLLQTEAGSQFLVREKAHSFLKQSERERQANRIKSGIKAILDGNVNSLRNKEVIQHLPATIESLISRGKNVAAATIIENITKELIKGDADIHDLLSESLSLIGESLINTEKWNWLEKLSLPLMAWVKGAQRADKVFEGKIEILQNLQKYYWKQGREEKADQILQLFFAIRTGRLKKPREIVDIVGKVQDLSVEKAPLADLLQQSLSDESEILDRRLIMQGPVVARFMIDELLQTEEIGLRLKLMNLLGRMGSSLPPLLHEKLREPMAWHGKRNLIKLLSETGNQKDVEPVLNFLGHEDERVQRATFSCIYSLAGRDRAKYLTKALKIAPFSIKSQILKALVPMGDDAVVEGVLQLLVEHIHFPATDRNALLRQIIFTLQQWENPTSKKGIESFLDDVESGKVKTMDDEILLEARSLLRQLKLRERNPEAHV